MSVRRSPEVVTPQIPFREILVKPTELAIIKSPFPRMGSIEFNCLRTINSSSETLGINKFSPRRSLSKLHRKDYIRNKGWGGCILCRKGDPYHECYRRQLESSSVQLTPKKPTRDVTGRKIMRLSHQRDFKNI